MLQLLVGPNCFTVCFCNVPGKVLPAHLWFCVGGFHDTQMKKYLIIECCVLIFFVD